MRLGLLTPRVFTQAGTPTSEMEDTKLHQPLVLLQIQMRFLCQVLLEEEALGD